MHGRNIYKNGVNLKELVAFFPIFRDLCQVDDKTGKIRFNFNDSSNICILTKCLLEKDFDIKLNLHANRLLPHLPLRLNYLCWIEDLLNEDFSSNNGIFGIDIGCGASCIYPLLALYSHPDWKFYVTEKDEESSLYCQTNATNNSNQQKIVYFRNNGDQILLDVAKFALENASTSMKGFTMCNPPFFSDSDYYNPLESKLGSNFFSHSDRSTPGGEYEFIKTMIEESLMLEEEAKHCILWFTSMIGMKKTVSKIEKFIESKFPDIQTYQTTSYCQGRKTRWYVGWSFVANPASLPKNRLIIFIKDITHKFSQFHENLYEHLASISQDVIQSFKFHSVIYNILIDTNCPKWSRKFRRKKIIENLQQNLLYIKVNLSLVRQPTYVYTNKVLITISKDYKKLKQSKVIEGFINNIIQYLRIH